MSNKRNPNPVAHRIDDFAALLLVSERAFGERGRRLALLFQQYNAAYFDGELHPVPILLVPVAPYGHWIGLTRQSFIYLVWKLDEHAERATLLHEMVHAWLHQRGENPKHAGAPWCREIMRISRLLGHTIHAGAYAVQRQGKRVVRVNRAGPHGEPSLPQREIATWPDKVIPPPLRAARATREAKQDAKIEARRATIPRWQDAIYRGDAQDVHIWRFFTMERLWMDKTARGEPWSLDSQAEALKLRAGILRQITDRDRLFSVLYGYAVAISRGHDVGDPTTPPWGHGKRGPFAG